MILYIFNRHLDIPSAPVRRRGLGKTHAELLKSQTLSNMAEIGGHKVNRYYHYQPYWPDGSSKTSWVKFLNRAWLEFESEEEAAIFKLTHL